QQVVILPMLRDKPEDEALIDYCEALRATLASQTVLGEPLRVLLDTRPGKAAQKRWDYVRKGAPVIVEVGGRDMDNGVISMLRRDRLWDAETGKPAFQNPSREVAGQTILDVLGDMQSVLLTEAAERRDANITRGVTDFADVEQHFASSRYPGWVEVQWSKPTGAALEKVVERLKEHKLTIRNVPMDAAPVDGACIFTGEAAVERVLLAKAY
ncbi:MAG: His/Gly/Thr/Pro-type tRNA ligase C-terminal domain-containing protein, partial [Pseudomonadota bacterium]|nr:His/Gly/Thr/Pro-type tRNA ligase C-terminal domain-containing protein [Pseudomonadota bacterium]